MRKYKKIKKEYLLGKDYYLKIQQKQKNGK